MGKLKASTYLLFNSINSKTKKKKICAGAGGSLVNDGSFTTLFTYFCFVGVGLTLSQAARTATSVS